MQLGSCVAGTVVQAGSGSFDLTPSLGTSIWHRKEGRKEGRKERKKERKIGSINLGDIFYLFIYLSFSLFRATPAAYGVSQARGQIGAGATSLHHSHSNDRSEPHLRCIPQLTATPDP